jgi:hypothetical protein
MPSLRGLIDTVLAFRHRKSGAQHGQPLPRQVACWDCGLSHTLPLPVHPALVSAEDFFTRHAGHQAHWLERPALAGLWQPNADIKIAYQAAQSMTVTNLHSLASSVTAGWQSAVVDNTSALYTDYFVMAVLDFANTAPANSKAVFFFVYTGLESGTYTNPASGSEGTITLVDVTANDQAMPMLGRVPYTTQDEVAESTLWSVATAMRQAVPPYWGVAAINHSGAALAASGNTVKYRGAFYTVI